MVELTARLPAISPAKVARAVWKPARVLCEYAAAAAVRAIAIIARDLFMEPPRRPKPTYIAYAVFEGISN
jgi:hypothetical protein